jgi:hypothetical protein
MVAIQASGQIRTGKGKGKEGGRQEKDACLGKGRLNRELEGRDKDIYN